MIEKPHAQQHIDRCIRFLKVIVQSAGGGVRAMERRLEFGEGSLGRILKGRIELKVRHVMMILDETGIEPSEFYRILAREEDPNRTHAEAFAELLAAMAPKRRNDDDLELRMRQIFERLMAEQKAEPRATRKRKAKRRENSRRTVRSRAAALA